MKLLSTLVFGALVAFNSPALAEQVRDGGIDTVTSNSGAVFVRHGKQVPVAAAAGADLFADDIIIINGNASVCITNPSVPTCLTYVDSPYKVKPDTGGDHSPGFLEYLKYFFGRPVFSAQSQAINARDGNDAEPFGRAALLPFGNDKSQFMPEGYSDISPLFRGSEKDRSWLLVSASGNATPLTWDAGTHLLTAAKPVQGDMALSITTGHSAVSTLWHIKTSAVAPPRPTWLPASGDLSDVERTERAVWLIKDGPVNWRLFGLTELAILAKKGHYEAHHLLEIANGDDCLRHGAPACPFMSN